MSIELIISMAGSIVTLVGNLIAIYTSQSKTQYRIQQLENRVKEHNNLIDRMYKVEKDIEVLKEKIE